MKAEETGKDIRETAVRLSGEGGQGLILAGVILAEAAFVYDNKKVAQTQNYGPEARGGKSASDVIISSEEIDSPKVSKLDVLLSLTSESLREYLTHVRDDGIVIADSSTIKHFPEERKIVKIPLKRLARERLGTHVATNIVSLGVLRELTDVVSRDALSKAVEGRVPRKSLDLNRRALELGFELGSLSRRAGATILATAARSGVSTARGPKAGCRDEQERRY